MEDFLLFSDGSSFNNGRKNKDLPQHATYAFCCVSPRNEKVLFDKVVDCGDATISDAEVSGALDAVETLLDKLRKTDLRKPYKITLYSDSQYTVKSYNEWMKGWQKRKWKNASGKTVSQKEQWIKFYEISQDPDVEFTMIHLNSHTGKQDLYSRMNDYVDVKAQDLMKEIKEKNNWV